MLARTILSISAATSVYAAALRTTCPDGTLVSSAPCCNFIQVRNDLINDVFEGTCGEFAHAAVRIAFHDAIGFSLAGGKGLGADGSIIAFSETELAYSANAGLDEIAEELKTLADAHRISYADAIHFGSSIALSLCAGAPRVPTFVGRPNATEAAPDGTVPNPFDTVDQILQRMADAGFPPSQVVALLASHSIAAQDEIEPDIAGSPFDSTPDLFDSQVYLEVLLNGTILPGNLGPGPGESLSPLDGEFRLQSDEAIARHPRTACTWQSFALNQNLMADRFSAAISDLNILGQNRALLFDCTDIIPLAPRSTATQAFFPPGKTINDIQASCRTTPFPTTLSTAPGTTTSVAPVPH